MSAFRDGLNRHILQKVDMAVSRTGQQDGQVTIHVLGLVLISLDHDSAMELACALRDAVTVPVEP